MLILLTFYDCRKMVDLWINLTNLEIYLQNNTSRNRRLEWRWPIWEEEGKDQWQGRLFDRHSMMLRGRRPRIRWWGQKLGRRRSGWRSRLGLRDTQASCSPEWPGLYRDSCLFFCRHLESQFRRTANYKMKVYNKRESPDFFKIWKHWMELVPLWSHWDLVARPGHPGTIQMSH